MEHPKVLEAMSTILRHAHSAGMSVGIGTDATADSSIRYAKMGVNWIQCGSDDAYLVRTAEQLLTKIRAELAMSQDRN